MTRGGLAITYVGHATVLIEDSGTRLLTDPVFRARLGPVRRAAPPPPDVARLGRLDAVLISHVHADHLDRRGVESVEADRVVVPAGAERWAWLRGIAGVRGIRAGERLRAGGCEIAAVPSIHGRWRQPTRLAADPLGYVAEGAWRVYFAGDTDLFAGMREIAPVDVALLPIWGWGARTGAGHMDPERAAAALRLLRARVAIPIHWGTYIGPTVLRHRAAFLRDPPRLFAEAAARVAPEVEVRALQPGARVELEPRAAAAVTPRGDAARARRG